MTGVNSQIVDAVEKARQMVVDGADRNTNALVQPMIAQAMGMALQNAVSHLQNLQTLEAAVTSQAVILLLEDPEAEPAANRAIEIMQQAIRNSIQQIAELRDLAQAPQIR